MHFVSVSNMAQWVAATGPEAVIAGMTDALERDFRRWPQFEKTPRLASHSDVGVIELMPTTDGEQYAFKYVNGHPGNPRHGLQTVSAFGVLADVFTGYPTFISEMTLLTALRTAATSALAARWLAPRQAEVMAMIGAGSQAEFQALGVRSQLGVRRLRVFDVDPQACAKLVRNLTPQGFEVEVTDSPAQAVRGAQIVTTCTADKANAAVLDLADIHPGVHINAVGGDCPGKTELDPRIVAGADVFVEYPEQTRIEGEIQLQPADFPVTELWRVIAGQSPGRVGPERTTVFDSVGFAIEDFTALTYVREALTGTCFAERIDLIAGPDDPKDLFGMLGSPVPA
ncbi:ornithine cyclodeaminase [Kineosporia sp. NBRC 101677]|uniref:ornithine cyclodeaminase n=1 Tax=Kineosporia sp. NBRC 101677 TaxID=3032197 RepID=UPI0024A288F4|nr:ornithine cyclodeaminase [Kineosporia sp. NBRC 101677]GLY16922.1 ornithine cyclodeaminase [Kineosporia sp. NBRC 101677]